MKNCFKSMVCGLRSFTKPTFLLFLVAVFSVVVVSCSKDRGMNQFHIQGQLVELGTNMPLRHAGVKFIIFKSHKSSPLVSAVHIPVDSFETDENGKYDHVFKTTETLGNFRLKVANTINGYLRNPYTYGLVDSDSDLKRLFLIRKVIFSFQVDNRNGLPSDQFAFLLPGMPTIGYFSGNQLHEYVSEQAAFRNFTINFGDVRNDSSYLIPIYITNLDSFTYTHVIP